jgi:hypothetical protein
MNLGAMISGLWGVLGALLPLLAGVGAAEVWEHRAVGQPAWAHLDVLFIHLRLPDSLAAQRDAARHDLAAAMAGEARLQSALAAQNATVQAQAAMGARALALAETDVGQRRDAAASLAGQIRVIAQPLAGANDCDRVSQADAQLLETLR